MKIFAVCVIVGAICVAVTQGCGRSGGNRNDWIPETMGGPIEMRPLPASVDVGADYQKWLEATSPPKVRLYEAVLEGASNQTQVEVNVGKGETPAGASYWTSATFLFRHPEKGTFALEWTQRGRSDVRFLRLGDTPKRVLLRPLGVTSGGTPRLSIAAIEGTPAEHVLVATPGQPASKQDSPPRGD